jgi:hypothetical protein
MKPLPYNIIDYLNFAPVNFSPPIIKKKRDARPQPQLPPKNESKLIIFQ